MNKIIFTAILSSLGTMLVFLIIQDVKNILERNKRVPEYKYDVGDKVIFRQSNCCNSRLVGCEILHRKVYIKSNEPCYRVKAYVENIDIWTISEREIECTAKELGLFPKYNK